MKQQLVSTRYEGRCVIFAGKEFIEEDEYWDLETEEETIARLLKGIETIGVICKSVTIGWTDENTGQRYCVCECYYDKPYEVYNSDFFINGLYEFHDSPETPLEFCLWRV